MKKNYEKIPEDIEGINIRTYLDQDTVKNLQEIIESGKTAIHYQNAVSTYLDPRNVLVIMIGKDVYDSQKLNEASEILSSSESMKTNSIVRGLSQILGEMAEKLNESNPKSSS